MILNSDVVAATRELKETVDTIKLNVVSTYNKLSALVGRVEELGKLITNKSDSFEGKLMEQYEALYELINEHCKTTDDQLSAAKDAEIERLTKAINALTYSNANYNDLKYELNNLHEEIETIRNDIEAVRSANESRDKLDEFLAQSMRDDKQIIFDLSTSFEAVTQGMYTQDNIEFAALKTYKGGWKYIFYKGKPVDGLIEAKDVTIHLNGNSMSLDIDGGDK